jgi:type I restriction enzyme R subunit
MDVTVSRATSFEAAMDEVFRRRRLPHWDLPGAIYFVTACLHGSIPAAGLADIERFRADTAKRPCPAGETATEWNRLNWKRKFAHTDHWLDQQPAVRHLDDSRLAGLVVDAMWFFADKRYDLLAYAVMPSHFHWVFWPRPDWVDKEGAEERPPRERIMHSLKLFTARGCNLLLGRKGAFWQDESYDHCVRELDELERVIFYVEQNPVRAGLAASPEDWPFSSAHPRMGAAVGKERGALKTY